jgi:hypothetical protein
VVSHVKGSTEAGYIQEEGAEEVMWSTEGGSNRKVKNKIA